MNYLEKWKKINEFLCVSDEGYVISHGKVIKGEICKNGYKRIYVSHKGKQYKFLIHRLVAEAFIENPENKPCVNRIDGNKQNNCVSNLEWVTYSENETHSYNILNKQSPKGEARPNHKLTEKDVAEIRKVYVKGQNSPTNSYMLAEKYNVSPKTIQNVLKRKVWKHVS